MQDHFKQIEKEIKENKIVLYMKGSRQFPMCGFSATVCQILENLEVEYKDVNILEDELLRSAIKEYTNWPTIPQLYVNGEFVGGCDIVKQMYENNELSDLLKK